MTTPQDDAARERALQEGRSRVLAMIDDDAPLREVLEEVCHTIEAQSEGLLTSVLLVDEDGEHLVEGAAPSLPDDYCEAVDGISIGEGVGCCGHVAATGRPFAVDDIATHPHWVAFKGLAHDVHGLTSCWSVPIRSWDGDVIATFAMYHRESKSPELADRKLADASSHLVGIALERARERDRLQQQPER